MKLGFSSGICAALLAIQNTVALPSGHQTVLNTQAKFPNAATFLKNVNQVFSYWEKEAGEAEWSYNTNITDANQKKATEISLKLNEITMDILKEAKHYTGETEDEIRQLELLKLQGGVPEDIEQQRRLSELGSEMVAIYSTAKYKGMSLEPELTEVLETSRDYNELLDAYIGWRKVTGPKIKPLYEEFVKLQNVGARELGYEDTGVFWRSGYDMDYKEFTTMMENVWNDVLPLYEQLHCYTRQVLSKKYGKEHFGQDGYIPAHLFGNMWSQDWSNINEFMTPFPEVTRIEITPELKNQKYDAVKMHKLSESFYMSLGLDPLPDTFWTKSMLTKPDDRDVVCHASAWDFGDDDLRIKMCTAITGNDLVTVHHEQGHLYYDHYYRKQPYLYRTGASDFFHESIGDTMALSVVVPKHLKEIGLLKGDAVDDAYKLTINSQMSVALDKIVVLPWTYLVDKWRWKVFSGEITADEYQKEWERLIQHYQGIKRPVEAQADDFDPGAKYHIPANTPYARYFGAAVIQFQFHEALCETAKHTGPLHECSIYKNKDAGAQFRQLLELGRSKKWQEAIKVGTGGKYDTLSGKSIIKYFEPLLEWLKEQNKDQTCGWSKVF